MDIGSDIKGFLTTRRARITPEQVGLPPGRRRRVPGLRREEVAQLAGVSIEYYTRIERGRVAGVSAEVLESVARALRLTEAETAHLGDLARAANHRPRQGPARRRAPAGLPDGVQALLDGMADAPAVVINGRLDVVAANLLGRAIYAPVFDRSDGVPNLARFVFLDAAADAVFPDWPVAAADVVALLWAEAARAPESAELTGLVGELATRSEPFRSRWAAHNVKAHHHGVKRFRHPIIGEVSLVYNVFEIPAAPGLSLIGYSAEPGSRDADAVRLLANWVASEQAGSEWPAGRGIEVR